MKISAATKIANLIKHDNRAVEAIISISPKFEKLRNPLLRKLLAGRTSIAMASKIAGCEVADFFEKLKPLGFQAGEHQMETREPTHLPPGFVTGLKKKKMRLLDVRGILKAGKDPLKIILEHLKELPSDHVLKISNTFEPTPLINMATKKGYGAYVETVTPELIETYFYKTQDAQEPESEELVQGKAWEKTFEKFKDNMVEVDVRHLPMPKPMLTILDLLENLTLGEALYVLHKKVPVYLLPELKNRGFDYGIRIITENEVHLLIYKEE